MSDILLIYSTTDGHTRHICQRLQKVIGQAGHSAEMVSIEEASTAQLLSYDKLVIGASIRYGRHRPVVSKFINNNIEVLQSRPNAFFSVNIVARKPQKSQPDTNPYLQKFLKQIDWQPDELAVFAGKLNYPVYSFADRSMIRFIMWMTHGPTDPNTVVEFTDWSQVELFGQRIGEM